MLFETLTSTLRKYKCDYSANCLQCCRGSINNSQMVFPWNIFCFWWKFCWQNFQMQKTVRFWTSQIVKLFAVGVGECSSVWVGKGSWNVFFQIMVETRVIWIFSRTSYLFLSPPELKPIWNFSLVLLTWIGSSVFYPHRCFTVYIWSFFFQHSQTCLLALTPLSNGLSFGKLLSPMFPQGIQLHEHSFLTWKP